MFRYIVALLVVFSLSGCATAETDPGAVGGALAGGAVGAWLGNGSGKQKEATFAGAVVGYLLGESTGNSYSTYRGSYTPSYYPPGYYSHRRFETYDARQYCAKQLPYEYRNNRGAAYSWIDGCVARLQRDQREYEERAYNDGYGR